MSKENDETKRYFFSQIQWAEKERVRHIEKAQRQRDKKRDVMAALVARADAAEAAVKAAALFLSASKTRPVELPVADV